MVYTTTMLSFYSHRFVSVYSPGHTSIIVRDSLTRFDMLLLPTSLEVVTPAGPPPTSRYARGMGLRPKSIIPEGTAVLFSKFVFIF